MKIQLPTFALLANLFFAAAAFAAPELTVDQGSFNFGTITQGKKVPHDFIIKNSGDAPLLIKNLSAACGCTAAKPSASSVLPGKTAKIQVIFDSENFTGKVQKSVTMTTNAGQAPEYTFYLVGNIAEELQVVPRQLSLGTIAAGGKQSSITVTNRGASSVKLLAVDVNSNSLQIKTTVGKSKLKPGESGTIKLLVTPRPEAKVLSGYLIIRTDHPKKKEISVPVYASAAK